MKRFVIMLMAIGVMTGSVAAAGAAQPRRVERTVVGSYGPSPTPVTGCHELLGPWACLIVHPRLTETSFTAHVADAHGLPVMVNVYGGGGWLTSFCGQTSRPIAIPSGANLEFDIGQGRAPFTRYPCPEHIVKTMGKITVTLTGAQR